MLLVIDSNEYIFAFAQREKASRILLDKIIQGNHSIRIPRTIFIEVKRNLSLRSFTEFCLFLRPLTAIDEDILVPFEIAAKYQAMNLKPADAFIAAYTEWAEADILITENRHFLTRAAQCLKLL